MKKYLSLFIVLLLIMNVISVKNVQAQSSAEEPVDTMEQRNGKIKELRKEIQDKRTSIQTEFESKREEIKNKIESFREEARLKFEALKESIKNEKDTAKAKLKELRITGREKALERFDTAINRVSGLADRVDEQISKLSEKEIDVTDAKGFLVIAQTKLEEAKTKTVEANDLLAKSIEQLTAEDKTKLRILAQETQALIKEAHAALGNAVKSLKEQVKIKMDKSTSDEDSQETNSNN